jgi:cell division protein ZapA (FtsZ GTPase activity inhibitor)
MAKIVIKSLDQEYSLRSVVDNAYLEGLTKYVDAKIKEICEQVPEIEPLKAAVFAALNIADEKESQKKDLEDALAKAREGLSQPSDKPSLIAFNEEDLERLKRISDKTKKLDEILE